MQLGALLAGLALAGSVGCVRATDLRDSFHKSDLRLPFDRKLRFESTAPVIVVGRVLRVDEIGLPRKSGGDPRLKTQLTKLRIQVEETIKGTVRSDPLEFYYFVFSAQSEADLGVPRYLPAVDQRRIYFLKPFEDSYRSVGDVVDYTLPVRSGVHASGFCRGKTPGCCIAEMLLVPGEGLDAERFVQDLVQAAYTAQVLCSASVARARLLQLTKDPDKRISDRAREILAMH